MQQNVTLFDIIATIESNNNYQAMRFEQAIYYDKVNHNIDILKSIRTFNKCSYETAHVIYSTSWGAIQIMGFNLYSSKLLYDKNIVAFLTNPDDQHLMFNAFLSDTPFETLTPKELASTQNERDNFSRFYNGPGNVPVYSDAIRLSLIKNGFEVALL